MGPSKSQTQIRVKSSRERLDEALFAPAYTVKIEAGTIARDHAQLLELIGWMCADSQTWAAGVSRTPETIAERSG